MIPGINPRQMQQMMRKMGIQQVDIPATEVIIKTAEKEIIIKNPSVAKVNMMGQDTFQISGGEIEEQEFSSTPDISAEDIKTVMEQAHVNEISAKKAIDAAEGNLAEAIMNLTGTND